MRLPWPILIVLRALVTYVDAYDAPPRWGQAAVVVNDDLYVYGGKTDEFNQFSYTSAPNTNDVLYLSLANSFAADSPPWTVASGRNNATSNQQGPALAWHTASAYNQSQILVLGGLPDVNSDIVDLGEPDSGMVLDVWDRLAPIWILPPSAWADQPTRRIRHSTATIPTGLVFIFGGERTDGSGSAYSEHYVFDPNTPSFTKLPTENGPPDLVGHMSIALPDGRILVFGGFVPSQGVLLLMSTIYVLDTTQTPYTWSTFSVSSGSLPTARRAFAATLVSPTRILIHGGSDASLQTTLDDGWLLDFSQSEAIWTRVDSLSGVGARRDHFAVTSGDHVLFGFGYAQSSPVSQPQVHVFNLPGSSLVPTFTPRPPTSAPPVSLPPLTSSPPRPTSTGATHTDPDHGGPTSRPDTPAEAEEKKNKTTKIAVSTSLAALALIAIVVGVAYYRHRKQKRWEEQRFWVIDGDDDAPVRHAAPGPHLEDDDSQFDRDIPLAGGKTEPMSEMGERASGGKASGILGTLGLASLAGMLRGSPQIVKARDPREMQERRNMLDDEDNVDYQWNNYHAKKREGTGGSSWSLMSGILGRHGRTRGSASASRSSTPWVEKNDPFGDGASLMVDEETGLSVAAAGGAGASHAARPRNKREHSHVSTASGYSYTDPFSDPIPEEPMNQRHPTTAYQDGSLATSSGGVRMVPSAPPLTSIRTSLLPLTDFNATALSPLSERTSQSTLPLQSSSSGQDLTPFSTLASRSTAQTTPHSGMSDAAPRSPTLLSGFLPPASSESDRSVKRSDSWWSRLARRASDASSVVGGHRQHMSMTRSEIRDPAQPPTTRLSMIAERTTPPENHNASSSAAAGAGTGDSRQSSAGAAGVGSGAIADKHGLYAKVARHGKSMSSVRTADSEAIERMAGAVEVVQRHASDGTTTTDDRRASLSSRELSIYEEEEDDKYSTQVVASPSEMEYHREFVNDQGAVVEGRTTVGMVRAPVPVRPTIITGSSETTNLLVPSVSKASTPSSSSRPSSARVSPKPMGPRKTGTVLSIVAGSPSATGSGLRSAPIGGTASVAARVKALEDNAARRLTVGGPRAASPSARQGAVDYGLIPRRSLFIVNPDNKRGSVGSEESR